MGLVRLLINSFLFAVWINSCEEKLVNLDQKNGSGDDGLGKSDSRHGFIANLKYLLH